jgi:CheY-like chemotaxis protein
MVLHQPTAKVLVVEDEMMLRMRAVDIVEDAGFMPVEAVNADDALAILESRSDIDLLFTDIQMPGTMDGLKLAHAVHARWPSIKIMLVSGQVTPTNTERPVNSRFYGKPLEVKKMIAELQEMMGEGLLKIIPDKTSLNHSKHRNSSSCWPSGIEQSRFQRGFDGRERQPSPIAGASRH